MLMAGIGIYFEKYFQESSIAMQKPHNLYLFEYQQMLVYIISFSILLFTKKTVVPVPNPIAVHFLFLK
jgi:hypothetical protein